MLNKIQFGLIIVYFALSFIYLLDLHSLEITCDLPGGGTEACHRRLGKWFNVFLIDPSPIFSAKKLDPNLSSSMYRVILIFTHALL